MYKSFEVVNPQHFSTIYDISPSKHVINTLSGSSCTPIPSDAPNEQNNWIL